MLVTASYPGCAQYTPWDKGRSTNEGEYRMYPCIVETRSVTGMRGASYAHSRSRLGFGTPNTGGGQCGSAKHRKLEGCPPPYWCAIFENRTGLRPPWMACTWKSRAD